MLLKSGALPLIGLRLTGLHAKESVNAVSGSVSRSGGSVSYSVGQVADQTYTGTGGSVAEGVQQPCEISAVTGIEEAKSIRHSVTAYPNPTSNYLSEIRGIIT